MSDGNSNPIALTGADRQVYVHDLDADGRVCLTAGLSLTAGLGSTPEEEAGFDWPAWSPDGEMVAFVQAGGGAGGALFASKPDGSDLRRLYSGARPFYLYWSPDRSRIAFLAQTGLGLSLLVVPADGSGEAATVVEGGSCYFDWAPDGEVLMVRVGGGQAGGAYLARVSMSDLRLEDIRLQPADFRAPSFSADGRRLLAAVRTRGGGIVVTLDGNGASTPIKPFAGRAAFNWSPGGDRVAVLTSRAARGAGYDGGLWVVDADGRAERTLATGEIMAFFWSPDGGKIAYFSIDPARDRLALTVVDADTGDRRHLASFAPSQSLLFLLSFFDQYALSSSLWSSDAQRLTYAGRHMHDRTNGHASVAGDAVYVVSADGADQPRAVAEGTLGFFAPGRWRP